STTVHEGRPTDLVHRRRHPARVPSPHLRGQRPRGRRRGVPSESRLWRRHLHGPHVFELRGTNGNRGVGDERLLGPGAPPVPWGVDEVKRGETAQGPLDS